MVLASKQPYNFYGTVDPKITHNSVVLNTECWRVLTDHFFGAFLSFMEIISYGHYEPLCVEICKGSGTLQS